MLPMLPMLPTLSGPAGPGQELFPDWLVRAVVNLTAVTVGLAKIYAVPFVQITCH